MPEPVDEWQFGDLTQEVQSGSKLRALIALRDQLARKIDAGPCHACGGPRGEMAGMASTTKELRAILDAIEEIPAPEERSFLDVIRGGYDNRVTDSPDSGRPPGGGPAA